jgi:hypothetical protein
MPSLPPSLKLIGVKRGSKMSIQTEQRNLFNRERVPEVSIDARRELPLDLYSRLDESLWPMAERLYARFGDGLVYVGPSRWRRGTGARADLVQGTSDAAAFAIALR